MELLIDRIKSDLGQILVVCDGEALCALDFDDAEARMIASLEKRYGQFQFKKTRNPLGVGDRLRAYFRGELTALDELPVNTGGTAFQKQVWALLRYISPGTVLSYREVAIKLKSPNACRAVGVATSQNPVAIVIPCHRIVGSLGALTGYAGGLERKQWLLRHEEVHSIATKPVTPAPNEAILAVQPRPNRKRKPVEDDGLQLSLLSQLPSS